MKSLRILAIAGVLASGIALTSGTVVTVASAAVHQSCVATRLRVSLGVAQGTAGTTYYPLVITNSGAACTIFGVAHVQPVMGGTKRSVVPVGPPARNESMGQMPVMHVVATGKSVSDAFGVVESGNYTPSACRPKNAGAVVVSMGDFVLHAYLPLKISVCTIKASTTTRLIAAGTTGY
jgi:hypothetical protein